MSDAPDFQSASRCGQVFESPTSLAFAMSARMYHERKCISCYARAVAEGINETVSRMMARERFLAVLAARVRQLDEPITVRELRVAIDAFWSDNRPPRFEP